MTSTSHEGRSLDPQTLEHQSQAMESVADVDCKPARSRLKRALDLMLGSFMLLVGSPVFAAVSAAIKLDDGGPVFYRQKRWGKNGNLFRVFKFRTMVEDSDKRFGIKPATEDDDRITRVGRVLRKTGLDELPQIINIVRGEMSFVGPRPLAIGELIYIDGEKVAYDELDGFAERLGAPPGLTGPATVYIPKDSSPILKFEHDVAYVREWTLWTDIKLILLSFVISFRGKWETRSDKIGL